MDKLENLDNLQFLVTELVGFNTSKYNRRKRH